MEFSLVYCIAWIYTNRPLLYKQQEAKSQQQPQTNKNQPNKNPTQQQQKNQKQIKNCEFAVLGIVAAFVANTGGVSIPEIYI